MRQSDGGYSYFTGRCLRQTDKAALLLIDEEQTENTKEVWVPLSVIYENTLHLLDPKDPEVHDIYIKTWFANREL